MTETGKAAAYLIEVIGRLERENQELRELVQHLSMRDNHAERDDD